MAAVFVFDSLLVEIQKKFLVVERLTLKSSLNAVAHNEICARIQDMVISLISEVLADAREDLR